MRWTETETPYRGEPSYGTNSIVVERKGYNVRTRGDTSGTIEHEYECPVHGRFRVDVERVAVPDMHQCRDGIDGDGVGCGVFSHWVPPLVGVGKSAGEVSE